jgi:hypothetical protein
MKFVYSALGLLILITVACNRPHQSRRVDRQVEWAYQLIDQGQFSEAIDLFGSLLREQDTPTIRLGLASAYAARAGIQVHTYWELILPAVKSTPPSTYASTEQLRQRWEQSRSALPQELQTIISKRSEELFKANDQLETMKWRFQKIPVITTLQDRSDLIAARFIIKDVEEKGSHLYRALLSLVLLRYELSETASLLSSALLSGSQGNCPTPFRTWLQKWSIPFDLVADFIVDLKLAYPRQAKEIIPFENQYQTQYQTLSKSIEFMEPSLCQAH